MTLVRHPLAADVRRFGLLLAIWVVVVAAAASVDGARPLVAVEPRLRESVAVTASLLWLAQLLLTFVIVSLVVHAHATVGSDAFWMTRPIPPTALLSSKLALLGVALVIVPAVADALLLAASNVPTSVGAGVIGQEAGLQVFWVVLLMAGAALTKNLARFALLSGAALVSFAVTIAMFIAVQMSRLAEAPPVGGERGNNDPTSLVVFNVLLVIAALALLMVQYRTRLRRRSIAIGLIVAAIAFFASSAWRWPLLAPVLLVPGWTQNSGALTVEVDAATISTNTPLRYFPGRGRQWGTVNGQVRIDGIETGWTASVSVRDASVHFPSGEILRSAGSHVASFVLSSGELQSPTVVRDVLGVRRLGLTAPPPSEPRPETYPALFLMPHEELTRYSGTSGEYRARLDLTLTNYVIDGVLPLQHGAAHQNGGYRLILDSVTSANGEVAIVARESRAASMWERRPWSLYTFYLRNRTRQEALVVSDYELREFSFARLLPFAGFSVDTSGGNGFSARGLVLSLPPRSGARAETLTADDAWLAGAEFVIVRRTDEGSVERSLLIPNFPLGSGIPRATTLR